MILEQREDIFKRFFEDLIVTYQGFFELAIALFIFFFDLIVWSLIYFLDNFLGFFVIAVLMFIIYTIFRMMMGPSVMTHSWGPRIGSQVEEEQEWGKDLTFEPDLRDAEDPLAFWRSLTNE